MARNDNFAQPSRCARRRECGLLLVKHHWPGASERGSLGAMSESIWSLIRAPAVALCLSAGIASAAGQLHYAGYPNVNMLVAPGDVVVSITTNSMGGLTVRSFHPPDHDWRLRIGGRYYGMTYNGSKAPELYRGTWILAAGHSVKLGLHIYVVAAGLAVMISLLVAITWRLFVR